MQYEKEWVDAIVEKLGGKKGGDALLQGELFISRLPFQKNANGHFTFIIKGRHLSGVREVANMKEQDFLLNEYTERVLSDTRFNDYNTHHILEYEKEYQIVLLPGCEVKGNRTVADVCGYAYSLGYQVPKAGIMPRIREVVSDKLMKRMSIRYIVGSHAPLRDKIGDTYVLSTCHTDEGSYLCASSYNSKRGINGAFAFLDQIG